MGWLYVQGLADSNSASLSPSAATTAPCVSLSGTLSPRPLSWRGWKTRPWIALLFGTTSPLSKVESGMVSWILSLRVSRANPFQLQVTAPLNMMRDGFGQKSPAWFARWDQASLYWKTSQVSFLLDSEMWSEDWPRSGTMRNGMCSARNELVPLTVENGSSLLPTPTATDWKRTPISNAYANRPKDIGVMDDLPKHAARICLCGTDRHRLSPKAVEWMMGFPIGWTAFEFSETEWFRWQQLMQFSHC